MKKHLNMGTGTGGGQQRPPTEKTAPPTKPTKPVKNK